jgi:predicted SAM-dependent methyltransferase
MGSDGSFDLIYALSVFTHIPVQWQMAWLQELHRVLRPRGYLLCTVLGNSYSRMLNEQDRATLKRDGAVTSDLTDDDAAETVHIRGAQQ